MVAIIRDKVLPVATVHVSSFDLRFPPPVRPEHQPFPRVQHDRSRFIKARRNDGKTLGAVETADLNKEKKHRQTR